MSAFNQAVWDRLSGDAELTALLGTFDGNPAIFVAPNVPRGAPYPRVVTPGPFANTTDTPESSKTTVAARPRMDLRCYDRAEDELITSISRLDDVAERVWELFHGETLSVDGWNTIRTRADRPVEAPTQSDAVAGKIVSIRHAHVQV